MNSQTSDIFENDMSSRDELVDRLKHGTKVLQSKELEAAFRAINRKDFVPDDYLVEAYEDYPLPIGQGQTISQPTTVAFMLELLDVKKGDHVLDIGCGSGYTTALLAELVGPKGKVLGLEIRDELVKYGRENLEKYGYKNVSIEQYQEGERITNDFFDKVLVSAATNKVPEWILAYTKERATIVIPVAESVVKLEKRDDEVTKDEFPGFAFVPLMKK